MLSRKMIIVLLARLVTHPLVQISMFVTVMMLFWGAHLVWQPYQEPRFALAEGASLLCLAVTASLTINAQPAVGAAPDAVTGVNAVVVLVNAVTQLLLLWTWLRRCAPQHIARAQGAATAVKRGVSAICPRRVSHAPEQSRGNQAQ